GLRRLRGGDGAGGAGWRAPAALPLLRRTRYPLPGRWEPGDGRNVSGKGSGALPAIRPRTRRPSDAALPVLTGGQTEVRMLQTELRPTIAPGDVAPDFELPRVDSPGTVSLADYRGRTPLFLALFVGL